MRYWSMIVSLAALLAAPAAFANSTPSTADQGAAGLAVDLGRADFRTYCAACHGVSGKGDGTVAEFLTIAAADLTRLTKLNAGKFPRERITEVIDGRTAVKVHGPRDMPVWGDWFDLEAVSQDTTREAREIVVRERINALVGYIESIQEK